MKPIKLILILLFLPTLSWAPPDRAILIPRPEPINPYLPLFSACCEVESSGRAHIINHREKAYGIVQIRAGKLKDYNRETGYNYTLEDCLNPTISYKIWIHFARKVGHQDPERIARRWNGSGPMTEIYWRKIKKEMY